MQTRYLYEFKLDVVCPEWTFQIETRSQRFEIRNIVKAIAPLTLHHANPNKQMKWGRRDE